MRKKLFDYVIGNPPYNEDFENSGDNGNFAKPVYNYFMDDTYEVAEKVVLIHPARFLLMQEVRQRHGTKKCLMTSILKL